MTSAVERLEVTEIEAASHPQISSSAGVADPPPNSPDIPAPPSGPQPEDVFSPVNPLFATDNSGSGEICQTYFTREMRTLGEKQTADVESDLPPVAIGESLSDP